MGLYARKDSPYWWMLLEPTGQKCSTGIIRLAPDAFSRRTQRDEALAIYRARMTDLARRAHRLPSHTERTVLFNEFAEWYDRHVIEKHKGKEREREILPLLVSHFGTLDLRSVTTDTVAEYETQRLNQRPRPAKPSTVNREVDLLKQILQAAVPKYLELSPLKGRPKLKTARITKRVLSPAEEARILAELEPADQALYIVAVDTLARLSNVINLTRAENKGTHLTLTDSKTGPYVVPLSTRARQALAALPDTGPYYFPHRRIAKADRDRRGGIRLMLKRACQRAGVPFGRAVGGVTFHTATRATGATRMLRAGVDPKTVQDIGNWASFDQMGEYLQTDIARKRAAVNLGAQQVITLQLRQPAKRKKR